MWAGLNEGAGLRATGWGRERSGGTAWGYGDGDTGMAIWDGDMGWRYGMGIWDGDGVRARDGACGRGDGDMGWGWDVERDGD